MPRGNEENLKPPTSEEARERGAKGGKASGKARQQKKALREGVRAAMTAEVPESVAKAFLKSGFEVETTQEALVASVLIGGMKGNVRMLELIADLLGEREKDVLRREMLDLDKKRYEVEKARTEAEIKRIELTTRGLDDQGEEPENDGFIEALNGTAAADWNEEDEDDEGTDV